MVEALSIDDFFLYTKLVKSVGGTLCKLGQPPIERLSEKIQNVKFRKFKNNEPRLRLAFENELLSKFGLSSSESKEIVEFALKNMPTS